jgi:DNA-binding HxlR family transcriptional regulator
MMLFGKETYLDFLDSGEGIATNVLADRLRRLESAGIVTRRKNPADRRQGRYLLTERGIDLLPLIMELVEWSAKHDDKSLATADKVAQLRAGRRQLAARLRRRLNT